MTAIDKNSFPARPKIIYMGTPDFALPPLKALIDSGHTISAVVTQPDRPKGRGKKPALSPVKLLALDEKIEILQPEKVSNPEFCDLIEEKNPDIIIVVAFGQILNKRLLSIPKWGVFNIHASLLPKYRGAAPIQHAVLNNESRTGLTVMRMDDGLDTGPILLQEEMEIKLNETAGQLHDRLAFKSGELISTFMTRICKNQIQEKPQDNTLATYAPKIEKSIAKIDWSQPAKKISALIRALDPKPGAYTMWEGKRIKLFYPKVHEESRKDLVPGRIIIPQAGTLLIETGKDLIEIRKIQYPGKKMLSIRNFLMGFNFPEGTMFGKG